MSVEDTASEAKVKELFNLIKQLYGITTDSFTLFNEISKYEKERMKDSSKQVDKETVKKLSEAVQDLMEVEERNLRDKEQRRDTIKTKTIEEKMESFIRGWKEKRDESEKKANSNWQKIIKITKSMSDEFKESISDAFNTLGDLPIIGDMFRLVGGIFGIFKSVWTLLKPFGLVIKWFLKLTGAWKFFGKIFGKIGNFIASPFRLKETKEERIAREIQGRETDEERLRREFQMNSRNYFGDNVDKDRKNEILSSVDDINRNFLLLTDLLIKERTQQLEEDEKRVEEIQKQDSKKTKNRKFSFEEEGINLVDFEENRKRLLAEEDGTDIAETLNSYSKMGLFADEEDTKEIKDSLDSGFAQLNNTLVSAFEPSDKYDQSEEKEQTNFKPEAAKQIKKEKSQGGFFASILGSFLPMLLAGGAILGGVLWLAKDAIAGYQKGGIFGAIKGALFGQFEDGMSGAFKNGGKFALLGGGIGFIVGGPAGALTGALVGFGLGMFMNLVSEDIIGGYEQGGISTAIWRGFVGQTNSGLTGMFKNAGKFGVLGAGIGFTVGGPIGALVGGLIGFVTGQVFNLVGSIIDSESAGTGLLGHLTNTFWRGLQSDKRLNEDRDREFEKDFAELQRTGNFDSSKYGNSFAGAKFEALTEEQQNKVAKARYEWGKRNRAEAEKTTTQISSFIPSEKTEDKPIKIEKSQEEKTQEVKFRKEQTDYMSKSKNLSDFFMKGDFWNKLEKFSENFIDEFFLKDKLNRLNDEIMEDLSRGASPEEIREKLASRNKAAALASDFIKGNKTIVNNVVNNTANNYNQMTNNNFATRETLQY